MDGDRVLADSAWDVEAARAFAGKDEDNVPAA